MIADLDETIKQLLIAELPIKNSEIDIKFDQPTREWSARLAKPTLNLFLYDVRENNVLRQHQWQQLANGNGRPDQAQLKRTPFRVDCFYLITSWAAEPEDEHSLLSRSLMALFRYPILPEDRLLNSLQHPVFDIQARLARHDTLTNPAEVWSALDNEIRPSISYVITLALDPWSEVTGPIVRTLTLRTGQAEGRPREQMLADGTAIDKSTIGGTVTKKEKPQPGLQVAVKGTGLVSTTNEKGQYTLGSLFTGEYTLVTWLPSGKIKENKIQVPAANYDIKL